MPGWVDLHVHSNYSFLDGASDVDDLADAAVEQGLDALALTDTNGLYGAVRYANAAKERGLRPIFGAELQLQDMGHVVLIARDRQGWTSLCRTISAAQLAGEKTKPKATFDLLAENAAGLFALTGCAHGAVPRAVRAGDFDTAREALARLGAVFGERLYVELSDHLDPDAPAFCDTIAQLASEMSLGCVVTNNVHYARPDGRRLHDVLRCIDLGTTLDEAGNRLKPNGEYWLKGEAMLRERLGRFDEAFRNAREIADACVLDLLYDTNTPRVEASFVGKDRLPGFPVPEGHTAFSFLYALCGEGAKVRYPRITRDVAKQLAHELDVIDRCGLAEFFLINWDIVRFCKEHRIPAQGRGPDGEVDRSVPRRSARHTDVGAAPGLSPHRSGLGARLGGAARDARHGGGPRRGLQREGARAVPALPGAHARDRRLPAASLDPQRRHAHHRAAARGHGPDRARDDARPQRRPVRQARRRGSRPREDGPARAPDALAGDGRGRRHRGAPRRAARARLATARRPRRVRPHLRGRHDRSLPGGEPCAGAGPAARAAAELRGHRRRGRDHPARPAAGEHGQSLHPPPAGPRAGAVRASAARADPQGDARRDPLPGADPPRRDRGRGILAIGRGHAPSRDEPRALERRHGEAARAVRQRGAREGRRRRHRERDLPPDRGLRRVRIL